MNEIEVFKLKLSELARSCGEAKTLTESHAKTIDALKTQKDQLEAAIYSSREEYRKFVALSDEYRKDFEKKKLEAQKELEKDKAEAKQVMQLAESQKATAERMILDAKSKESRADGVMKEANAAKAFWESKKETIKTFLTSGA